MLNTVILTRKHAHFAVLRYSRCERTAQSKVLLNTARRENIFCQFYLSIDYARFSLKFKQNLSDDS